MKTRTALALAASIMGSILSSPSFGIANIGTYYFLHDSPAELFGPEDWSLFEATLFKTLDDSAENVVNTWENPKSQFSGEITIIKTVSKGANQCRAARITSQASDRSRTSVRIFCKAVGGQWKLSN